MRASEVLATLVPCPHCGGDGQIDHASNAAGNDSENCWLCHEVSIPFIFSFLPGTPFVGRTTPARAAAYASNPIVAYRQYKGLSLHNELRNA